MEVVIVWENATDGSKWKKAKKWWQNKEKDDQNKNVMITLKLHEQGTDVCGHQESDRIKP